jgi:branched-chain amino acid transport system permease protein
MTKAQSLWNHGVKIGALGGVSVLIIALVGMIESFGKRDIIAGVLPMGIALVLIICTLVAYLAAKKTPICENSIKFANAVTSGLVCSGFLAMLVLIGRSINLREMLVAASPMLYKALTAGIPGAGGIILILTVGLLCGIFAGTLTILNDLPRKTVVNALATIFILGLLQELILPIIKSWDLSVTNYLGELFYTLNGLTIIGTILSVFIFCVVSLLWNANKDKVKLTYAELPAGTQKKTKTAGYFVLAVFLILLPQFLGLFLSEVLTIVGLYILLGLGLNIVVGYAGLLDLGYVAFFAIGSYVVAILTSPELFSFGLNFWQALPIAVLCGIFAGVMLGIPVLKMRGDYLAIATLGFGEIIRILVLSDFLRPWLGGAQGVGSIPNPNLMGFQMAKPQHIYYLILAGCMLVVFISIRLKSSRLGRAWMAMREDEDVAQAMGINLVQTKLFAFATGAGFSALSGAIFASKIGSVYPHSFNVFISINVVCLIIIGGIGSLPGVVVGAAVLMGLPELLREFAEYRMFVYGAALVAMMLLRPEGLWPEARHKMELHSDDETKPQTTA